MSLKKIIKDWVIQKEGAEISNSMCLTQCSKLTDEKYSAGNYERRLREVKEDFRDKFKFIPVTTIKSRETYWRVERT